MSSRGAGWWVVRELLILAAIVGSYYVVRWLGVFLEALIVITVLGLLVSIGYYKNVEAGRQQRMRYDNLFTFLIVATAIYVLVVLISGNH